MKTAFWKADWFFGLVIVVVIFAFSKMSGVVPGLERWAYDLGVKTTSKAPSDKIAIIAIDDQSIQNIGRWPWSREVHAKMIDQLAAAHAKVIGNTTFFFEPQKDPGLVYVEKMLEVYNKAYPGAEPQPAGVAPIGGQTPAAQGGPQPTGEVAEIGKLLSEASTALNSDARLAVSVKNANNVLIPVVNALKGNPGVYSYEIFNEPEGMTTQHGWTQANGGTEVDQKYIQKTVNVFASAIHTTDPNARVTSGAQTFGTCSNATGGTNLYSNSALTAAGGMANGTLDFYEVHYYTSNGSSVSCFTHPASNWKLDKNLVMGEFWAVTTDGVNGSDLYTNLYSNGYNGAWAWNYTTNDDNGGNPMTAWPVMKTPMQNLYTAQKATLDACP